MSKKGEYNPYRSIPPFDQVTAAHKTKALEEKVKDLSRNLSEVEEFLNTQAQKIQELERLTKRMDNFIKWQFFRGTQYEYSRTDGPGHMGADVDTYYPKFDVTDK